MKVTELIIDRQKWLRGEGNPESALYRASDGRMCCLGFYCLAAGYSVSEITGKYSPMSLIREGLERLQESGLLVVFNNSRDCYSLMFSNDTLGATDSEREARLTELFAQIGTKVTFIN